MSYYSVNFPPDSDEEEKRKEDSRTEKIAQDAAVDALLMKLHLLLNNHTEVVFLNLSVYMIQITMKILMKYLILERIFSIVYNERVYGK